MRQQQQQQQQLLLLLAESPILLGWFSVRHQPPTGAPAHQATKRKSLPATTKRLVFICLSMVACVCVCVLVCNIQFPFSLLQTTFHFYLERQSECRNWNWKVNLSWLTSATLATSAALPRDNSHMFSAYTPPYTHTDGGTVVVESAGRVGAHAERRLQRLNEEFINAVY